MTRPRSPNVSTEYLPGLAVPQSQAVPTNGEDQDMADQTEEAIGAVAEEPNMIVVGGNGSDPPGGNNSGSKLQEPSVTERTGNADRLAVDPLAWLKCIETNQGCVNCIEMDPRRR